MPSPTPFFKEYVLNLTGMEKENIKPRNPKFRDLRSEFDTSYEQAKKLTGRTAAPFSERDRPFQILFKDCFNKYEKKAVLNSERSDGGDSDNNDDDGNGGSEGDDLKRVVVDLRQKFKTVFIEENLKKILSFKNFYYQGCERYLKYQFSQLEKREGDDSGDESMNIDPCENDNDHDNDNDNATDERDNKKKEKEKKKMQFAAIQCRKFANRIESLRKKELEKSLRDKTYEDRDDYIHGEYYFEDQSESLFEFDDVNDIWKEKILYVKPIFSTPYDQVSEKYNAIKKKYEEFYLVTDEKAPQKKKNTTASKKETKAKAEKVLQNKSPTTEKHEEQPEDESDFEEGEIRATEEKEGGSSAGNVSLRELIIKHQKMKENKIIDHQEDKARDMPDLLDLLKRKRDDADEEGINNRDEEKGGDNNREKKKEKRRDSKKKKHHRRE